MKKLAAITVVVALMLGVSAWAEDGAALFKAKCTMCHGPDGANDKPMVKGKAQPFPSAEFQKQSDADIKAKIGEGISKKFAAHPSKAKGLTDPQIDALVQYLRSLKK